MKKSNKKMKSVQCINVKIIIMTNLIRKLSIDINKWNE